MDYAALGKRIRQRRIQLGWTQEALAKEIGMSTSFIGHIERGTRAASVETLLQMANAMSVSLDDLLADYLTWQDDLLEKEMEKLGPGQRQVMQQVLSTLQQNLAKWNEDETPEN